MRSSGVFGAGTSAAGGGGVVGVERGAVEGFRGRGVCTRDAVETCEVFASECAPTALDSSNTESGSRRWLAASVGIACPMGVTTVCGGSGKVNVEVTAVRGTSAVASPSPLEARRSKYQPPPTAITTVAAASAVERLRSAPGMGRAGVMAAAVVSSAGAS